MQNICVLKMKNTAILAIFVRHFLGVSKSTSECQSLCARSLCEDQAGH